MREERKIKVKELKKQNLDLKEVRPLMRQRASKFGDHNKKVDGEAALTRKKTIIANFNEDETLEEFPDTRSIED